MKREIPLCDELVTRADLRDLIAEIEDISQELHSIGQTFGYFPADGVRW